MRTRHLFVIHVLVLGFLLVAAWDARAQGPSEGSRFVVDLGAGIDVGINGNVNSGAIGRLQGQTAAILPNPYGAVYGTGIQFRVGLGYLLNDLSELRGVLIFQSADANLVRMGDVGPSSLYGQYSDYQSVALDLGYRRYFQPGSRTIRGYAEGTIGLGFIDSIDVELAAPQSNIVVDNTDFYDQTSALTWSIAAGALFRVHERMDLNAQIGLRRVSGLSEVDQLVGTGLEDINNDSARLTIPFVVGVRFRFP